MAHLRRHAHKLAPNYFWAAKLKVLVCSTLQIWNDPLEYDCVCELGRVCVCLCQHLILISLVNVIIWFNGQYFCQLNFVGHWCRPPTLTTSPKPIKRIITRKLPYNIIIICISTGSPKFVVWTKQSNRDRYYLSIGPGVYTLYIPRNLQIERKTWEMHWKLICIKPNENCFPSPEAVIGNGKTWRSHLFWSNAMQFRFCIYRI